MPTGDLKLTRELLARFDLGGAVAEPLPGTTHHNHRIRTPAGDFFLKVVDRRFPESRIRSQLAFMNHLRTGGLPVLETIATTDGEPFAKSAEGRSIGILSRWIDGRNVSELDGDGWVERCGELLARFHQRAATFRPADGFEARAWDEMYAPAVGGGWLGEFLPRAPFDDDDRRTVLEAVDRVREMCRRFPRNSDTYGLIHADFHADNLIFDGETIWIVDFEEFGRGHFLFDLTWPEALYAKHHGSVEDFSRRFRAGYASVISLADYEEELTAFRLAAGIGVLEMIDTLPVSNDSERTREWFTFALDWMRKLLSVESF